ncbi:hypothetical protein [Chondromyces apiculatus]|uniref:PEGA domain-containing protein n=1 Tax=Chondromyces apiculatus DSM 436 TaxID=1192034 RepID=A0A017TEA1_9BACT|nr:hypothetical protein [Chondromyces apiculatus]EYF06941.1 Hypothetical protein CAP_1199 [Chondromyces apiculatus DSM 436]
MTHRLCATTLLAFLCLAPATALADDISDADRATARTLAVEGQDALERGDFRTALDRFSRADAIIQAPTLRIGVARAQVGVGELIKAQETYNRILRENLSADAPEAFVLAVEEARKEVAHLAPRIPAVTITLAGDAPSPRVTIDDVALPAAVIGVRRLVDPGPRVIRATAEGYVPAEARVSLTEGSHQEVRLTLTRVGATPPAAGGKSPDGAEGGGFPAKTLGIVALGVGGAGLILGGVTGGLALGKHSDLSERCPGGQCPSGEASTLDSYHTLGTLSTVGFVVGGVGVAAGTILLLTAPRASSASSQGAWIAPRVGLGYLGAEGRF